jgi:NADPH:quinone reductase
MRKAEVPLWENVSPYSVASKLAKEVNMQSYWMRSDGNTAVIEIRDVERAVPSAKQIEIRVRAAGLNRGEFILSHGLHKPGTAKAIGMEAAGEVVACGESVKNIKIGDRVMGRCPGAFAEYALMDQAEAMPMPTNLSWEQAAAIPLTAMVVFDMVVIQGHLRAGEWVLIPGVTSGVGVTALALAKALGAKVIGTSGSQSKLDRLQSEGLDLGLCTRKPDFYEAVMRATGGQGINLVINTVGGSMFAECIRAMAFEGRLATVGYVDNVLNADIDIQALHTKRLTLFGVSNKLRTPVQRSEAVPAFKEQVLPLIHEGKMKPIIECVFPFHDLIAAKEMMDTNQHLGKIILNGF